MTIPPKNLVRQILDGLAKEKRLDAEQAIVLLDSHELTSIAHAASEMSRRLHPEPYRTYNIDRNINYTNVCTAGCRFCAFSCSPGDAEGYVLEKETLFQKIEETIRLGGDQILLQGGMNPALSLEWCEDLLRSIRERFPSINIHGFSPTEIDHLSKMSGLTLENVLQRLCAAGLGSLPGGGAEILVDRVRDAVSPNKVKTDRWLEVCHVWHKMGGRGSATMMFGHLETTADRVEHLARIRRLQDETGGFTAFIPWTFQPAHTEMADRLKAGTWDYLKTLAVSRLYLDNIPNIQASWVTQGLDVGELALAFGANDMGSLMIEENVVAAAGTSFKTTEIEIRRRIEDAGYEARRRNVFYELVDEG